MTRGKWHNKSQERTAALLCRSRVAGFGKMAGLSGVTGIILVRRLSHSSAVGRCGLANAIVAAREKPHGCKPKPGRRPLLRLRDKECRAGASAPCKKGVLEPPL